MCVKENTDRKKKRSNRNKSTLSTTRSFLFQEVTSTSESILFLTVGVACTIFVFMNYFLLNIGQQLINLTSVFITLFIECISEIFKNITRALK